ncbi:hypothetical protein SUGI_0173300 [Cryptomeria japonica]|uniref:protein THYLAKOID ASSEMBLY 8-like, chloroplastic n=1 Tax=Cryptomeria japonica TaxID=3369 RepID=UPI002408AD8D|nr:protein THYLAKOID ASSEMBLY 8-like, chloroplastic [Cryptomeria japonica]GLJ11633.1 hypothetical protein SUGI_0173300 [Cryptomeria japonica]
MSVTIIYQFQTLQTAIPISTLKSNPKFNIKTSSQNFLISGGKKSCGLKWSIQKRRNVIIMRDKGQNRGPLWRGRLLSNEAIQAVQALRRAKKDTHKLENAFQTKIARLLKKDLLSVLGELQRQDQCDLALQVFETVRKEMWYKPSLYLYADMITMLGRNKLIENVEALLVVMQQEGLRPDTRVCTEIIGSFLQVGMVDSAMKTFELMKQTECHPDKSTFTVLFKGLKGLGELELSDAVKEECVQYLGEPLEVIEDDAEEVVTTILPS